MTNKQQISAIVELWMSTGESSDDLKNRLCAAFADAEEVQEPEAPLDGLWSIYVQSEVNNLINTFHQEPRPYLSDLLYPVFKELMILRSKTKSDQVEEVQPEEPTYWINVYGSDEKVGFWADKGNTLRRWVAPVKVESSGRLWFPAIAPDWKGCNIAWIFRSDNGGEWSPLTPDEKERLVNV